MAFNPFSAFRKHQKVIFAVLTILCMVVFIFQFGRGDIFERLLGRAGGQGKGDKVVTLYGRDVTTGDLELIKQSRQAANDVIVAALGAAEQKAVKDIGDYKPDTPDPMEKELMALRESWNQRAFDLQLLDRGFIPPERRDQALESWRAQARFDYARASDLAKGIAAHTTDAAKAKDQNKILAELRLLLRNQFYVLGRDKAPFYFGGGVNADDLLDFEIWKRQADKLGVVLTKADVRRALAHAGADLDAPQDPSGNWGADPLFKEVLGKHQGMTEDQLATAVVDEFRVRIAQDLLDGPVSGVAALDSGDRTPPDPISLYDFWKYYRDNRTTIKVAFLTIPVQAFLGEVQKDIDAGKGPSEQELQELFDQYRSKDPNPNLPTPGFKEPHRMKLEYVVATGDTPYYKAYADAAQYNLVRLYVSAPVGGNAMSGGVAPLAVLAGLLNNDLNWQSRLPSGGVAKAIQAGLLNNESLLTEYERGVEEQNKQAIRESCCLFGLGFGDYPAITIPAIAGQAAADREKDEQLRLASAAFLLAADNGVAGTPFAGVVQLALSVPRPLPREDILRQAIEKVQKTTTSDTLTRDLRDFCDGLDKLKGNADKAKEEIQKAVKERGWALHNDAALNDQYHIDDDPALKVLKDTLNPANPFRPPSKEGLASFFTKTPLTEMKPGLYAANGPYRVTGKDDARLAFWRSEEANAHELSYSAARQRVLDAWKFQEARKRALERAEQINADVQMQASAVEVVKALRDAKLGDQKPGVVFELPEPGQPGIARLVPGPTAHPGINEVYERYVVPADKIPNAPSDLVDRLLGLEKPGQTLVFKDQPAANYYVAVLEERPALEFKDREKDPMFIAAYANASLSNAIAQPKSLWRGYFLPDRQKEYRKNLMRSLREEAAGPGGLNDQGQLVLSGKLQQQQQQQPAEPAEPELPINDLGGL
jgi:hypothetical protein